MAELIVTQLAGWGLIGKATIGTATAIANLGVSVGLSALAQLIAARQRGAADASREIAQPDSLPPYRDVYGIGVQVQGSPAPLWVVQDGVLYGCIILNSRPSEGGAFAMYLDRRAVGLTGDVTDFGEHQTGTATILEGNTYVDVAHGLSGAPIAAGMAAWTAEGPITVSTIGSTTLRLELDAAAPVGGTEVTWRAVKGTDGGVASNEPFFGHVNVWFGIGDQQHPPARILEEVGDLRGINPAKFWATDRWATRTVLWVRFVAGDAGQRADRWPSTPPLIEVRSNWSKVWDPRDEAQDADDPATWRAMNNQALCLLDALRLNPVARYPLTQIRVQDFIDAADIADQLVPLKAGGAERRYRVGAMIVYKQGVELSEAIRPLEMAGAGNVVRIGGMVGYAPGAWSPPDVTLDDCTRDEECVFRRTRPTRDLPGALTASHPDPAANWERAEEQPRQVDPDWDGGTERISVVDLPAVFSDTQAQRVLKIMGERLKLQKSLSAVFFPRALDAVSGGRVTVALPRVADRRNGTYRVVQSHPAIWLEQGEGVALRLPLSLEEDAAAVYAWDPDTDEVSRVNQLVEVVDPSVGVPEWTSATLDGSAIDLEIVWPGYWVYGGEVDTFFPEADTIQAQYRQNQDPFWLPMEDFNRFEDVGTATLPNVITGASYDFRIRGRIDDRVGAWVYRYAVQVGFTLGAPSVDTVTAGTGQIEIDATAPSDTPCAAVQFWVGTSDDPEIAILYLETECDPSDPVSCTATGLPAGVLHYVFVRAVTAAGAVGPWAATTTATPT